MKTKDLIHTAVLTGLLLSANGRGQPSDIDSHQLSGGIQNTISQGNTYFVDPAGDDENPGTMNEPWETIQHAANTLTAGDTVFVRGGIYNEVLTINVSGSITGGYIIFRNAPGETPILDGTSLMVPDEDTGLFLIDSRNYIVIDGFELRNYITSNEDRTPIGIFVIGNAHHIQIKNNHIHNIETNAGEDGNAHGIAIYGTQGSSSINNIRIEENELHDLKLGNSEALVLNGNVEQFTLSNNTVYDCDNIGIDLIGFEGTASVNDRVRDGTVSSNTVHNIDTINNPAYDGERSAGGIYVDGGTRITIEQNIVYQCNIGIEIASEHAGRATSFITVRNNMIYNNHIAGLAMGGYDTNRGSTENCTIVNNTLFRNDSDQDGNGELFIQYDARDNLIANNIFYTNNQNLLMSNAYTKNTANVVDYNLYFAPGGACGSLWQWKAITYDSFSGYQAGSGNDTHSQFADPQLTDPGIPDLHLQATSPAVDAGHPDLDGDGITWESDPDDRDPDGTRIDLGAFYVHQAQGNGKGDVIDDGIINVLDVLRVVNIILQINPPPTENEVWAADCNGPLGNCEGDENINILDALKIVNLILGIETCP